MLNDVSRMSLLSTVPGWQVQKSCSMMVCTWQKSGHIMTFYLYGMYTYIFIYLYISEAKEGVQPGDLGFGPKHCQMMWKAAASFPPILLWISKMLENGCSSGDPWRMHSQFFWNSSACETGIHWNLRLEPFAGVVFACISHAIFLYETDAFCFRKWRVVVMGSTKCLFVDVFRQNSEVVCGLPSCTVSK